MDWIARPDQLFDIVKHIPDVDVHTGQHPLIAVEPESHKFAAGNVAAEHHPIEVGRVAGILHAEVVLVCEEVREISLLGRV